MSIAHICHWCHARPGVHRHHQIFRSRDVSLIDYPLNLIWLCLVCHGAAHGERVVDYGFSCQCCHFYVRCPTGTALYASTSQTETLSSEGMG